MTGRTNAGTGGAAFRFKYFSSTISGAAAEGTIGVITTTTPQKICISPLEPESPTAGMLWVKVGTIAAYPVTVGGNQKVTICPVSTFQFLNSAWELKTAKTYVSGSWCDWNKIIIVNGQADVTMVTAAKDFTGYAQGYAPTVGTEDSSLTLYERGEAGVGYHAGLYECNATIDLTPFSSVEAVYKTQGNNVRFTVCARASQSGTPTPAANFPTSAAYVTNTLDVSSMTGEQYFSIGIADMGTYGAKVFIRSLTLVI